MAPPSRVALLMSVRATDETSMRMLPEAMEAARSQKCNPAFFIRFVECNESEFDHLREVGKECCGTPVLEPQPVTLNNLWQRAEADYLPRYAAIYNSDDAWLPGGLDRLVSALDANPSASLAYGDFLMGCPGRKPFAGNVPKPGAQDVALVPVPCPFYLMRVSAVSRLITEDPSIGRPFDPRFPRTFDHALAVRLATVGPFAFVPEPVAVYLNRGDSLSHADPTGIQAERRDLQRWAAEYMRNRPRFA